MNLLSNIKGPTYGYVSYRYSFMMNQKYSKLITELSLNKNVKGYLKAKDIKFILGKSNHQKAKVLLKHLINFSRLSIRLLQNDKIDGIEWDLRLTISGFLNF